MSVEDFVRESNRIEGITRCTRLEVVAHENLWRLDTIRVADLERFVTVTANADLRRHEGQDVRIVSAKTREVMFTPPPGGPVVESELATLLRGIYQARIAPYAAHVAYETLHPFTDGNGRSGRALWAWQMFRGGQDPLSLGFLHNFYYQALEASRF